MTSLDIEPVPVKIIKSPEELTELAVEFGGTSTWSLPLIGTNNPVQILQRRPTRKKARIFLLPGTNQTNTVTANGSATSPGALANIASTGLQPAGLYQVTVFFTLSGTVGAGDNNNIRLVGPGLTATTFPNNIGTAEQTFGPFTVNNTASGVFQLTTVGAGTVGSIYTATIIVTPISNSGLTSIALAHRADYLANPSNPQGLIFPASVLPREFDWESQQPCYAVAIGAAATVLTLDQAQAAAQSTAEEDVEYLPEEYQEEGQGGTGPSYQ